MKSLLLLLVAGAMACAPALQTEHVLTGRARDVYGGDVKVIMEGAPLNGDYQEVAIVNATGAAAKATLPAVIGALQDEARKLGCNAVIRVRYDRGVSNATATGVAVWLN